MTKRVEVEAEAACIVVDRHHIEGLDDVANQLGGGWKLNAERWKQSEAPFLLLLANSAERIRNREPIPFIVMDAGNLGNAVASACALLSDCECAWIQMLNDVHKRTVQNVLALEATAGNA